MVESPDDAAIDVQIWVFDQLGAVEDPTPSTRLLDRKAAELAERRRGRRSTSTTPACMPSPVVRNGKRLGTLVAGVGLHAYSQAARTALIGSIVLAALLFGLVVLASRSILRRASSRFRR